MKIHNRFYSEHRGDKNLIIFPDKPFWIVGDNSLETIIRYFSEEFSKEELYEKLISDYKYEIREIEETLNYIEKIISEADLDAKESDFNLNYENYFPLPVINVTRRCNLSCRHCYADAGDKWSNKEMTTEQIKKVIYDIAYNYAASVIDKRILLSGGEPFLRKDIIEIIKYIKSINATPLVNTNALLIDEKMMDTLKECGAELLVSLDGAKKENHEFIRGIGTYDKTIEKIKLLKKHNVITKLSMTLHSGNIEDLKDFFELAEQLEADGIAVNILNILERADKCNIKRVPLKQVNAIIRELSKKSSKAFQYASMTDFANMGAILLMNWKFVYCGVGAASLVIDYDGSVYPCYNNMRKDTKLGNILYDDMLQIWRNSDKLKELRRLHVDNFGEKCRMCPVKYYCGGGCRGETFYESNTYLAPCPNCQDNLEGIIDLMFMLSEGDNELFENRIKYYESIEEFKKITKH